MREGTFSKPGEFQKPRNLGLRPSSVVGLLGRPESQPFPCLASTGNHGKEGAD